MICSKCKTDIGKPQLKCPVCKNNIPKHYLETRNAKIPDVIEERKCMECGKYFESVNGTRQCASCKLAFSSRCGEWMTGA